MIFLSMTAIISLAAALTIPSKWRQKCGMERQRDEQREKILDVKREIAKYKDWQYRFKTDAKFVEHIARETRRVQPGELVFVFDAKNQ